MKKKFALILILTLLLALGAFAACGDPHEHDLQHFEAKDPNCEKEGNIEYWYCAGCGKYFADEAAEKEIAKEKTVLAATGEHDWSEWVIDSESSCTIGGMRHRVCNDCGERQEETLPIGEHDLNFVQAEEATCTEEGNVAYWTCSNPECNGKYYADKDGSVELESIVLPRDPENHTGKQGLLGAKEATCTEAGYSGDVYCTACNTVLEKGHKITALGHQYQNGVCTRCGQKDPSSSGSGSGQTPSTGGGQGGSTSGQNNT